MVLITRPRIRWLDDVCNDMKVMNVTGGKNRKAWNDLVEKAKHTKGCKGGGGGGRRRRRRRRKRRRRMEEEKESEIQRQIDTGKTGGKKIIGFIKEN